MEFLLGFSHPERLDTCRLQRGGIFSLRFKDQVCYPSSGSTTCLMLPEFFPKE